MFLKKNKIFLKDNTHTLQPKTSYLMNAERGQKREMIQGLCQRQRNTLGKNHDNTVKFFM